MHTPYQHTHTIYNTFRHTDTQQVYNYQNISIYTHHITHTLTTTLYTELYIYTHQYTYYLLYTTYTLRYIQSLHTLTHSLTSIPPTYYTYYIHIPHIHHTHTTHTHHIYSHICITLSSHTSYLLSTLFFLYS